MTSEQWARRHVYHSIVKKWGANRQKLWSEFDNPLKTKEHIIANVPAGIARDQWASFVNYRCKEKTRKMCKINAENRKKLTDLHTGGSKSNARRRGDIIKETGRRPGRAEIYLITHKREDGSYVNEKGKEICEKIELAVSQSTVDESIISPNDAVGKVLGKEHPGRVRCLGVGATPTIAFKQSNVRVGGIRIPSNDAGCSSSGCEVKYNQLLNTLKTYMIMKEGSIPEQFAGIFDSHPTMAADAASGSASSSNSASNSSNDVIEEPFR